MGFSKHFIIFLFSIKHYPKKHTHQQDEVSVHSDDSTSYDNQSINSASEQSNVTTPNGTENGRIRPTRPAPAIPSGLTRNTIRRSAPHPPSRQSTVNEPTVAPTAATSQQAPQPQPRRSATALNRQDSVEDNTAVSVRT